MILSRIISRSNSAKTPNIWNNILPDGVLQITEPASPYRLASSLITCDTAPVPVDFKGVDTMKALLSILALILTLAFTGRTLTAPAFAGMDDIKNAKTEGDCMLAGGTWDEDTKTCSKY